MVCMTTKELSVKVWIQHYSELQAFLAQFNRVPKHLSVDEEHFLWEWSKEQRVAQNKGELSAEQQNLLSALPNWSWAPWNTRWQSRVKELTEFVQTQKRYPLRSSLNPNEKSLAEWCIFQRQSQKLGKLSEDKQKTLLDVTEWNWVGTIQNRNRHRNRHGKVCWNEMFKMVKEFCLKYGFFPRPHSSDTTERRLGTWCRVQKVKELRGILSAERKGKLESLPVPLVWCKKQTDKWNEKYREIAMFFSKNSFYPRFRTFQTRRELVLAWWISRQKESYQTGKLSNARAAMLEVLTGWKWNTQAPLNSLQIPA